MCLDINILQAYFEPVLSTTEPKQENKLAHKKYLYLMLWSIWYHLYNLKNLENAHGGVLLLVKLQAEAESNTLSN